MKKIIKNVLILIIIGFTLGFLNSLLIYSGFWQHFFLGLGSVPFYFHIIYIFLGLFFSIFFHELGHYISMKIHKIPVKGFVALGLAFIKIENRIKIRFIPKFMMMIGGIVIPDHISISNEVEEEKIIDAFEKILIAGPNTSIIYGITVSIMWIMFLFTNLYILNGFLFSFNLITLIMTFLVIVSSKMSHQGMYGDYVAKDKIKNDKLFRLNYLLQITSMFEDDKESLNYFWPRIIENLSKPGRIIGSPKSNLLLHYLNEITYKTQIGCSDIDQKIVVLENLLPLNEEGFLLHHQMIYYYKSLNQDEMVEKLLKTLNEKVFVLDKRIILYQNKLTNHILGITDETEFLSDKKNIYPNSSYFLYKPLGLSVDYNEMKL